MKGTVYQSNVTREVDSLTGVEIIRLTDNKGIYDRPYFTSNQFSADGTYTIFASDFSGTSKIKNHDAPAVGKIGFGELFNLELETGKMLQLTEGEAIKMGHGCHALIDNAGKKAYFYSNEWLKSVDLRTLEVKPLIEIPFTYNFHSLSITNDDRYLAFCLVEEVPLLSTQFTEANPISTPGSRERFFKKPSSLIIRYDTLKNDMHVVYGHHGRITHVSLKPDDSDCLLYCHEGPWYMVQRMWTVRISTDEHSPLVKQQKLLEAVGHEFFTPGGRIGTQYSYRYKPDMPFFMFADIYVDFDGKNEERFYYKYTRPSHVSADKNGALGVGDSAHISDGMKDYKRYLSLIQYNTFSHSADSLLLCAHDSSGRKSAHVHPVFTPDGTKVVFSSDKDGRLNIYMAEANINKALKTL